MGFAILAALLWLVPAAAAAQCDPAAPQHRFTGFRSAQFGMTQAEVREAIPRDFGAAVAPQTVATPDPATTALKVSLLKLNPAPGPASITYLFAGDTGRLVHVNVGWVSANEPTELDRRAMATAGLRLQRYFGALPEKPCEASNGGVVGPGKLLLYRGRDDAGRWVEVTVQGVRFETPASGTAAPAPRGPAILQISYGSGAPAR